MKTKFKQPALLLGLVSLVFTLTIFSCKKETLTKSVNASTDKVDESEIETLRKFLSTATGAEIDKIEYKEGAQQFFIDGDMMMPLSFARGHYEKFKSTPTRQRVYPFIMNSMAAATVRVYIDPSMPAAWITASNQAIVNWTATNCLIKVTRVYAASSATIVMTPYYDGSTSTIAFASFPDAAGNCGPTINVNTYYNTLSASQKQFAITHEMGHCFGFTHTNQTYGAIITGTPVLDPNSVMNATVLNWNGFTPFDYIAYGVVYPNATGTKRFLRYYYGGSGDHFYTTNTAELGAGASNGAGYKFELDAGYIYPNQVAGTVPLYRYWNPGIGDHFYTTNYSELGGGAHGWTSEGIAGYLYPNQVAGTIPLYRYWNTSVGDHFYTTNYGELGGGGSGYVFEGIAGYVR